MCRAVNAYRVPKRPVVTRSGPTMEGETARRESGENTMTTTAADGRTDGPTDTRFDTTDGRAFRPTFKRFSFAAAAAATVFAPRHLRIFAQKMTPPPPPSPPPLLTPPHVTSVGVKVGGKNVGKCERKNKIAFVGFPRYGEKFAHTENFAFVRRRPRHVVGSSRL